MTNAHIIVTIGIITIIIIFSAMLTKTEKLMQIICIKYKHKIKHNHIMLSAFRTEQLERN